MYQAEPTQAHYCGHCSFISSCSSMTLQTFVPWDIARSSVSRLVGISDMGCSRSRGGGVGGGRAEFHCLGRSLTSAQESEGLKAGLGQHPLPQG